jgi:hypothetical protein
MQKHYPRSTENWLDEVLAEAALVVFVFCLYLVLHLARV